MLKESFRLKFGYKWSEEGELSSRRDENYSRAVPLSPKMTKTRNLQTRIPNHADMKITALTDTRRNLVIESCSKTRSHEDVQIKTPDEDD